MYQRINDTSVRHLPSGTVFPLPPVESYGHDYQAWLAAGNTPEPALVEPIAARRAAAWAAVKAERSRRKDGGVLVSGHWFQTDSDSRIQLMRLDSKAVTLLAGGGAPTDVLTVMGQPIPWKTTENGLVPMTAELAQNIVLAVEVLDAQAFGRAEVLRQQIEASESPELIDISTGWPVVYGGAQ